MTCTCGHSIEEHGDDPEHPGSTACIACGCIAYEEDDEDKAYEILEDRPVQPARASRIIKALRVAR
jgi:hypothetical protein